MTTDPEIAKQTLLEWSMKGILHEARLSDDGQALTYNDGETILMATVPITIEGGGGGGGDQKTCTYTVASIYLQILDPKQGLMPYRNACKQYHVKDAVKALDKPTVVGYFLKNAEEDGVPEPSPPTVAAAQQQEKRDAAAAAAAPVAEPAGKEVADATADAAAAQPATTAAEVASEGNDKKDNEDDDARATTAAGAGADTAAAVSNKEGGEEVRRDSSSHRDDSYKDTRREKDRDRDRDREREQRDRNRDRRSSSDKHAATSSSSKHRHSESGSKDRDRDRDRHHHHKSSSSSHHHKSPSKSSSKEKQHGHHRGDRDREHRGEQQQHRDRDRGGDNDGGNSGISPAAKKAKLVTNEQLFSNLNVVVDKRTEGMQMQLQETQREIMTALSADGFDVTPELIDEHRDTTRRILSNEIPVGDSSSILRASNPKKDLLRVLELYNEAMKPKSASSSNNRESKGGSGSAAAAIAAAVSAKPVYKRKYLVGKKPVIIVPKGMTAPITLINAHEFLCNGKFIPRDVMMKQQGGGARQRQPMTTFTRNVRVANQSIGGGSGGGGSKGGSAGGSGGGSGGGGSGGGSGTGLLEYEIMDSPRKLGPDPKEWERIVAVIVLGQSWQFTDWIKPYNNPTSLFSMTFGFYVSMEGNKIPPEVENGWAVRRAVLNRDKRGMDSITYTSFWNGLDEFMSVHKAELLPQSEH